MATPTDAKTVFPALRRLFMPGRGVAPPYLAGRENELNTVGNLLDYLTVDKTAPPGDAVLIGPRGNGKTVLLNAFATHCRGAGAEVTQSTPAEVRDEGDLAEWLLGPAPTDGTCRRRSAKQPGAVIGSGIPLGAAGTEEGRARAPQPDEARADPRRRSVLNYEKKRIVTCPDCAAMTGA